MAERERGVAHFRSAPIGSQSPVPKRAQYRRVEVGFGWLALYAGLLLAVGLLGTGLLAFTAWPFRLSFDEIGMYGVLLLMLLVGLFALAGALFQWPLLIESSPLKCIRDVFGDRGARNFYIVLGATFVGIPMLVSGSRVTQRLTVAAPPPSRPTATEVVRNVTNESRIWTFERGARLDRVEGTLRSTTQFDTVIDSVAATVQAPFTSFSVADRTYLRQVLQSRGEEIPTSLTEQFDAVIAFKMANLQPAHESVPTSKWSAAPDPAVNPHAVSRNLRIDLPGWAIRANYSARRAPFVMVSGLTAFEVYDLRNGSRVGELANDQQQLATVSFDVSPNGRLFASRESPVKLASLDTGQITKVRIGSRPQLVEFISDDVLLTASSNGSDGEVHVELWDVANGNKRSEFTCDDEREVASHSLATSPGGRYLSMLTTRQGSQPTLLVYEINTGKLVGEAPASSPTSQERLQTCRGFAFSPDGAKLSGLWASSGTRSIRLVGWDFLTGKVELSAEVDRPDSNSIQPGDLVWDATSRGWIVFRKQIVDAAKGSVVGELPALADDVIHLQLIDRNHAIVLTRGPEIKGSALLAVDPTSDVSAQLAQARQPKANETAVVPASPLLAPPSVNLDTSTSRPPAPTRKSIKDREIEEVNSPIPVYDWNALPDPPPELVKIPRSGVAIPSTLHGYAIYARASYFVCIWHRSESLCKLYDLRSSKLVGELPGPMEIHTAVALSPNGEYLAGVDNNKDGRPVVVWSFKSGEVVGEIETNSDAPNWLGFSAAGHLVLAFGGLDRFRIAIHNAATLEAVREISLPNPTKAGPSGFTISPGGKYAAVLIGRALHVLDLASGETVGQSSVPFSAREGGNAKRCDGLRFSPAGTELAAWCCGDTLVCWDFTSGKPVLCRWSYDLEIMLSSPSWNDSLFEWLADGSGWIFTNSILVERQTGSPVWLFNESSKPGLNVSMGDGEYKSIGGDALLTTQLQNESGFVLQVSHMPSQAMAALREVQHAPSELEPPRKASDVSSVKRIETPANVAWDYHPDPSDALSTDRVNVTVPLGEANNVEINAVSLAPAASRIAFQKVIRYKSQTVTSPLTDLFPPFRQSLIQVYDLFSGKLLGEMPTTGRYDMLDISPDGSLILTGECFGRLPYQRLDVWAPSIKKHAVAWQPAIRDPWSPENLPSWALFVDKRVVISETGVLWKLPECQALHETPRMILPNAISPRRKYIVTSTMKERISSGPLSYQIYEMASGRCVGVLDTPDSVSVKVFGAGSFRPDAEALAIAMWNGKDSHVIIWDLKTGAVVTDFPVPISVEHERLEWLSDGSLVLMTLNGICRIDPQRRAIVQQYEGDAKLYGVGGGEYPLWVGRYERNNFDPTKSKFVLKGEGLDFLDSK